MFSLILCSHLISSPGSFIRAIPFRPNRPYLRVHVYLFLIFFLHSIRSKNVPIAQKYKPHCIDINSPRCGMHARARACVRGSARASHLLPHTSHLFIFFSRVILATLNWIFARLPTKIYLIFNSRDAKRMAKPKIHAVGIQHTWTPLQTTPLPEMLCLPKINKLELKRNNRMSTNLAHRIERIGCMWSTTPWPMCILYMYI